MFKNAFRSFLIFFSMILISFAICTHRQLSSCSTFSTAHSRISIVLDPGHGGADPGKVGVNHCLEKDINLQISFLLQQLLSQNGYSVTLTRSSDCDLSMGKSNAKRQDLRNRIALIQKAKPDFVISIHQNSYPKEAVCGPQVFYYQGSTAGEALAGMLQESLNSTLAPSTLREAKANDSYFLLKKAPTPTVIVECGFLSNYKEANLLVDSSYQEQVASAIFSGIEDYLAQVSKGLPSPEESE